METAHTCYYCGQPAALLCDGVLGLGFTEQADGSKIVTQYTPTYTCDRSLCSACAADSSPIFFDGTDADGERWGEIDSTDYCPGCVKDGRGPGGPLARYHHTRHLFCTAAEGRDRQRDRLDGAAPPSPLRLVTFQ